MSIRSKFSLLREYLTPINHNSNFSTTGEITPEEFVKAGDYLTYKFPTWEWSSVPEKLAKDFLPKNKQVLVTRHVPSYQRAFNYLGVDGDSNLDEDEEELEDGWVKSHKIHNFIKPEEVKEINGDEDEIDELDGFIDEGAEPLNNDDEDFEDISNKTKDSLRKYDLYICYSTSYRVPKLYLVGFNSNGIPLLPQQMFEDISSDYRDKTATIENLPVTFNTTSVSIHPCRHSSVMKVFMKHAIAAQRKKLEQQKQTSNTIEDAEQPDDEQIEANEGIRVDQYLIIFLKFIASVTPGIEYDYTMEVF